MIHTAYNQLPELLFNSSSVNYTIASIANFNKYVICYLTYFAKCFTIRYDDLISIPYIPFYHSFSTIVCTSIPKVPFNRLSNRTQRNQVTVPWKDGIKQLLDRLKAVDYITSHTERTATQQNDGSRQDEKSNRSVYIVRIKVLK